MASSSVAEQKKVMLLSRLEGPFLVRMIDTIRQTGCHIALVATAAGYNHSLNDKNYDDLADRVRAIYTTTVDPPPVVTVTGVSQLLPFLHAVDPDLVITCVFPYQLTKAFLAHRSIKINMHPSPLPLYRGSSGGYQLLLKQPSTYAITWHYVTEEYDAGNILIQESFPLQPPYGMADIPAPFLNAIFTTIGKAIEMALSGHPGTPQRQPTPEEEPDVYPKPLTIAQRTITGDMTCHQIWTLVEACKFIPFALLQVEERLYHVIEARRLETSLPFSLTAGEIRRVIHRFVHRCSDGHMEYVVRIV